MRKVILQLAISLDGYIEGPDGEFDWCFTDQDYGMKEFLNHVDTTFVGRKTYELTKGMGGSGFPKLREYIFTNSLTTVKKDAEIIQGNIKDKVIKIKNQPGKDIWLFGGAELTASLMNLGLVDEIALAIHPILLGGGKLLFNNLPGRVKLKLKDSKTYSSGLVMVTYTLGD